MEPEHEYHIVELNYYPPDLYQRLCEIFGPSDDFTNTLLKRRWFFLGKKLHFYNEKDHLMFLLKYGDARK